MYVPTETVELQIKKDHPEQKLIISTMKHVLSEQDHVIADMKQILSEQKTCCCGA